MDRWTLVLEAVPGALVAIRVDEDDYHPVDVELVDGDAAALGETLSAVVQAEGGHPDHVVLVVPGDLEDARFEDLIEAVDIAGLPEPSWLPDAVAWVGAELAVRDAGTPVVVLDTRDEEIGVWSIRTADDGVEIGRKGATNLTARLDALLAGVVHAKLAVVAPETAEALRRRADAEGRRDAAHLDRELREARRVMCSTDGEELVVSVGEAEVYLTRDEFIGLVEHALAEALTDAIGTGAGDPTKIIVADRRSPVVEHLAGFTGALVVDAPEGRTSLDGAAALVLPRPGLDDEIDADPYDDGGPFVDPDPTDGVPVLVGATADGSAATARPPRWAVPTLSAVLVLTLAGAGAVLAGPLAGTTDAGVATPVVGLDLPATGR